MLTDTIPRRLREQAKARPDAPAYFVQSGGAWKPATWSEYERDVRRAAKAFVALGLPPGSTACILGANRPEWTIFHVACMAVGGAPAGIYVTSSPDEVRYIVDHAESAAILVDSEAQWKKVEGELSRLPRLRHVVFASGVPAPEHPIALSWEAFLAKGDDVPDARVDERIDALEPDGLATLIYTSGTTGPPKGVMLSHQNLAWTADAARKLTETGPNDVNLSYLPLSHIAEQMFTVHLPITAGGAVYYAEALEKLGEHLKEVQPTTFFGVPRVWEKLYDGVSAKLCDATGAKRKLAEWAMRVGREAAALRNDGRRLPAPLAVQHALANALVYRKIKAALGLGRARLCVTGAAPIAREVLEFFAGLDILIYEVYGQSEDTGPTSFNRPGRARFGTVGPTFPGVDVKIAEDGEILAKGPNVFLGYYKEPEATAETLVDGWLRSGDLGAFDEAGYLTIKGRKKEIIITAGGKNISPKNIESEIKSHPLVAEAVVIGDRRKYLTALVTLVPDAAASFARERGVPPERVHEHEALIAEVQKAVDEANAKLARVETVKKFRILPRPFSIEHGELTPTLKVKRKAVHQNFASDIDAMYAE